MDRHLNWDGCRNVRDLGGLGRIRRGALVRADSLQQLTPAGWSAVERHGVRTVVDLRNPEEIGEDAALRPPGLITIRIALDGMEDTEFWERWMRRPEFGTPIYYRPWLEHFPERAARVLAAIAGAEPGGVAYHCGIGRDRTGLVTTLLLALLGVSHGVIAADYALSEGRVPPSPELNAFWAADPRTASGVVADLLAGLDAEAYLLEAGVTARELAAVRERSLTR